MRKGNRKYDKSEFAWDIARDLCYEIENDGKEIAIAEKLFLVTKYNYGCSHDRLRWIESFSDGLPRYFLGIEAKNPSGVRSSRRGHISTHYICLFIYWSVDRSVINQPL